MGFRPSPKPHIPRSRSLRRREIRERIGRTDSSASHQSGSGARTRNALPGTTSLLYSIQQQKGPAGAGGFAKKKKKETTKGKSVFEKKSCARLRAISMVYNLNMQDMVQTPIRLTVHARAFGNFTGVLGFSSSRKWRRKNFNGKPQTLELHANDFNAKYFSFCLEKKNQKTSSSSAYFVAISSV